MPSITDAGIRTAALLPHFFTVVFMALSAAAALYIHDDIQPRCVNDVDTTPTFRHSVHQRIEVDAIEAETLEFKLESLTLRGKGTEQ